MKSSAMKKLLPCLAILLLLLACRRTGSSPDLDEEFRSGQRLLFSQRRPLDSLLTITPPLISQWDSFCQAYSRRLESPGSLPPESRRNVEKGLEEARARILSCRQDPSTYNLGGALKQVLAEERVPLPLRLNAIQNQMKQATAFYQAAKANLTAPLPEKCRLAAEKHRLSIEFLNNELMDSLRSSTVSRPEMLSFQEAAEEARIALKDYLAFCESLYFEHQDSLIFRNY